MTCVCVCDTWRVDVSLRAGIANVLKKIVARDKEYAEAGYTYVRPHFHRTPTTRVNARRLLPRIPPFFFSSFQATHVQRLDRVTLVVYDNGQKPDVERMNEHE